MGHEHNHAPPDFGRAFAVGIILNLGFVVLEVICGRLSNSLALVAKTANELHDKFGIEHTTLQVEFGDPNSTCRCRLV